MKEKKLKIQEELAELREELNRVDRLNLDSEALKAEISRLTARRAELEKKLIEDVFSAEPDNLPGAWQGLRKGMIAALRSLEEALAAPAAEPVPAPAAARPKRFAALRERLAAATASPAFRWIATVALVYLLLVAVGCLGAGFKEAFGGSEGAKSLFRFATNPFMGLVVPLAAAGVMKLPQVYPFTLGANIGTCVTALLAAFAITGAGAAPALQVALIHLLFNSIGVVLIYSIAFLRGIPLSCAGGLAALASRRKGLAFLYVVGVFFLLPLVCLGVYRLF